MVSNFVPQGTNAWNYYFLGPRNNDGAADPVAYPSTSTPAVTVQINWPSCASRFVSVPIPSTVHLTSPPNENELVDMLPNGDQWDFYDVTKPGATPYPSGSGAGCAANSNWQSWSAVQHSPGWTGSGNNTCCWGDSNLDEGYGDIRLLDTQSTPTGSNWGHALNWSGFDNCAVSNSSGLPRYVAPATGGDGQKSNTGCFPMGSRWQLDPSINCSTWPSMVNQPEWMKQMCRTLQVYGMIDAHSANCQGCGDGLRSEYSPNFPSGQYYPWQNPSTGAWPGWNSPALNLPPDLLSHFRVIDWTKWTG